MTRLRNTNFDVFIQCQYTRTILRNENMGQSLFKKYSKFQKFGEILYEISFRNVKLGVFRQYHNTKTILRKTNMGKSLFKKFSKLRKSQLVNFTLTYSNEGKK